MEEIRFNLFKSVDKGLRALLADTLMQLQQTDFLIEMQAKLALERIKVVLLLLQRHNRREEDIVFQNLGAQVVTMTGYFTNQHYHTIALTPNMDILIGGFMEAKTITEKEVLANNLMNAFMDFTAYNFQHMNMEEQLINPLLWNTYSDQELQGMQMQHLNPTTRKAALTFLHWMLIHNTHRELAGWLNSMNHKETAIEFNLIFGLAQQVLTEERLEFINLNVYANDN